MEFTNFRKELPELKKQAVRISSSLGADLVPQSEKEDIFALPLGEIKTKYPERYAMYLAMIRKERGNLQTPSVQEIEKMKKWLSALNSLDSYIESHKEENGKDKTLREHQVTVFESLRTFLERGGKEGYIKLPTGYGKTVIFTEFLEATDLRALIVVPRKLLVEQTKEKFEEFAEDVDVGKIYSEAKQHGKKVTITTYDSLLNQLKKGTINPDDYDCLILDEAHRSLSDARMKAIQQFNDMLKLGFTATPVFTEQKQVSRLLETEIHNVSIREAVDEGALSPFSVMAARTHVDLSNVRVTSGGDYDERDLARAVNIEARNIAAVKVCKEAFANRQTIAYCVGVSHAEKLASMLNEAGIPAATISGDTSSSDQKKLKKMFASGAIRVLCNADILIEGFDVPESSVCLNLRPTLSRIVAEQRGGRVLRLDEKNPEKHAIIFEFIDQDAEGNDLPQILFSEIAEGAFFPSPTSQRATQDANESTALPTGVQAMVDLRIAGLSVIYDTEEIMRVTREICATMESIPENWLSRKAWIDELGIGYHTLQERINLFLETEKGKAIKPGKLAEGGNYAEYQGHGGKVMRYSPEFRNEFKIWWDAQEFPVLWFSCNAWSKQLGISNDTLLKRINLFLQTEEGMAIKPGNPAEGGNYAEYPNPSGGSPAINYSLEFRIAFEEWWKMEKIPETWLSTVAWSKQLNVPDNTLQKRIKLFLLTEECMTITPGKHTDDGNYAEYPGSGPGGKSFRCSLEFRILFEKWWKTQEIPKNWLTGSAWARELGMDYKAHQKRISRFLQTEEGIAIKPGNPAEGGNYAEYPNPSGGSPAINYSPEFRVVYHHWYREIKS